MHFYLLPALPLLAFVVSVAGQPAGPRPVGRRQAVPAIRLIPCGVILFTALPFPKCLEPLEYQARGPPAWVQTAVWDDHMPEEDVILTGCGRSIDILQTAATRDALPVTSSTRCFGRPTWLRGPLVVPAARPGQRRTDLGLTIRDPIQGPCRWNPCLTSVYMAPHGHPMHRTARGLELGRVADTESIYIRASRSFTLSRPRCLGTPPSHDVERA